MPVLRGTPLALLMAFVLAGCNAPSTPNARDFDALAVIHPVPQMLPRERVWDGTVEAVDQATLSAQTGGRVRELPFDVNDYVEAGTVVVRFTDVEQQAGLQRADAAHAAATAAAAEAEAEYRRVADLQQRGLLAKAQLDTATARRNSVQAAVRAAEAALSEAREQVEYTQIRAPYSGILTQRHVEIGESVRPGQALVSGLSLKHLRLHAQVPQADAAALRGAESVTVLLDDGRRIPAHQVTVFPYADPATHSFDARIAFERGDSGLHPGMVVRFAFATGEEQRLLLPLSAVQRRGELALAWVQRSGTLPQLRQLRLGRSRGDQIEVLAGIEPGDPVVVDAQAALRLIAESTP